MDLRISAKVTKVGEDVPNTNLAKGTKLYARRWYILGLYVIYMLCNSSQWLQYSIISNIVGKFYGISNWKVNLTSLVMMACYLPLALPAASLMDRIVSSNSNQTVIRTIVFKIPFLCPQY